MSGIPPEARDAAARALADVNWRPETSWGQHTPEHYDYKCALCRPDLDDGYGRITDAVLAAAAPYIARQARTDFANSIEQAFRREQWHDGADWIKARSIVYALAAGVPDFADSIEDEPLDWAAIHGVAPVAPDAGEDRA